MNKRQRLYAVLAGGIALVMITVGLLYMTNKGMPAVQASDYLEVETEAIPVTEESVSFLIDSSQGVPGMKRVAQDQRMALYYNEETSEIAVRDGESGQIWYSNPPERTQDSLASAYEKDVLSSQVNVFFRDATGTLENFPNFGASISNKQFTVSPIEQGIRVTYTIGDTSLGINALPKLISKQRLEEKVLSKLDTSVARYTAARYYPSKDNPEVLERLDGQISRQLVLNKMLRAFEEAGYTADDLAFDNEENGVQGGSVSDKPSFVIPIEYRLDQGALVVKVPLNQVKESGQYRIRHLDLLAYFGAAGTAAEGYMLIPDGSGSLIHLNNGKIQEEQYVQRVYGPDPNDNSLIRPQISQSARMPVFGMKNGENAWFAVIEKGDGMASITADIGGRQNSYNHVHASFALRGEDELEMYTSQNMQEIQLLSEEPFRGDVQVRYQFLQGKDASYSGMARLYQQYLVEAGVLEPLTEQTELPFYMDILGAVDIRTSFLSVPYRTTLPMTTYEQAAEIASRLQKGGVNRIQMRFQGWFGGGFRHHTPTRVKLDHEVGTLDQLWALSEQLKQSGGTLFPDAAFQQIYHDDLNFAPSADAARFVTRETAELYPYNPALNRMDQSKDSYYLLSAAKLPYVVNEFAAKYSEMGLGSLSLRDLGQMLVADYRDSRVIHRETAKHIVQEQLDQLKQSYPTLMLSAANSYAWRSAQHIVNIPAGSSRFSITDEEVPFYAMVIHGYMNYAASPMNTSGDQNLRKQLLRSLELGAAPYFQWTYEPSSKLKLTNDDAAYATEFEYWADEAIDLYKEANTVLGKLENEQILQHERVQDGVVRVTYSGGTTILLNYNEATVHVDGSSVNGMDYVVEGADR
ncbi:hypothetical protein PAECIP112173_00086 [Paenibacillus sp. JJ-100]|uniref:DUF5696 domain-containing protein n=1 Tax=Paenibacillus sp. JJ-100 TaxID=2974896 RepID=UPI0022FFB66F|nr:DUF5696 domain-containing protein [Paenibacillus sp. JJ-100]CAI6016593.1 hypothetical protein PAECIP112173_00086 [Paenibacillus sp. JJ-100]